MRKLFELINKELNYTFFTIHLNDTATNHELHTIEIKGKHLVIAELVIISLLSML